VPRSWPGFTIAFRYLYAHYDITVANPKGISHGVSRESLDGQVLYTSDGRIPLADDGAHHSVEVVLG
jgi:cyclic beta-1,2-glucan synthetase